MANDNDLIRRGDALAACQGMDPEGDIAALPAVTVGVPLKQIGTGLYEQPAPDAADSYPYDAIEQCERDLDGVEDEPVVNEKLRAMYAEYRRAIAEGRLLTDAAIREDDLAELIRERDELRSWDDYFRKTCGYKRDGRPSPECLDEFIRGMNDTNRHAALSAAIREAALREAADEMEDERAKQAILALITEKPRALAALREGKHNKGN